MKGAWCLNHPLEWGYHLVSTCVRQSDTRDTNLCCVRASGHVRVYTLLRPCLPARCNPLREGVRRAAWEVPRRRAGMPHPGCWELERPMSGNPWEGVQVPVSKGCQRHLADGSEGVGGCVRPR